jgi:L-rhamnose-H+ transport protein
MGKSQLPASIAPFAWSILMALNIAIGNIWGIALGEWKGVSKLTMGILIGGILVLILSSFVVSLG